MVKNSIMQKSTLDALEVTNEYSKRYIDMISHRADALEERMESGELKPFTNLKDLFESLNS